MRIAVVGPFTGPVLSGAFAFAAEDGALPPGYPGGPLLTVLAKALVERGHQVAAVSTCYTTPIGALEPFRRFRSGDLQAYFCPQRLHSMRPNGTKLGRALDFFRYERACLVRAIDDFEPDVIHAHWSYEFTWAALDSGRPTVATAHDSPTEVLRFIPNAYRLARYLMARRVLARCTHLTAVSPDLEADLRTWSRAPITVVTNPIEPQILDGPGCATEALDGRTVVMVLNGWGRMKNGTTGLRAFALARQRRPDLRLICFGIDFEPDGPAAGWAAAHRLDTAVDFRGERPHRQILDQMRSSMVLLHPSRFEASSMAIAEAMSVGLPVIAGSDTPGVGWQLDGGRCGVLVDVNDAQDMAQALVEIDCDAQRWARLSQAARSRARQMFSLEAVMDRYLELYHRAMRAGGAPATRSARSGALPDK